MASSPAISKRAPKLRAHNPAINRPMPKIPTASNQASNQDSSPGSVVPDNAGDSHRIINNPTASTVGSAAGQGQPQDGQQPGYILAIAQDPNGQQPGQQPGGQRGAGQRGGQQQNNQQANGQSKRRDNPADARWWSAWRTRPTRPAAPATNKQTQQTQPGDPTGKRAGSQWTTTRATAGWPTRRLGKRGGQPQNNPASQRPARRTTRRAAVVSVADKVNRTMDSSRATNRQTLRPSPVISRQTHRIPMVSNPDNNPAGSAATASTWWSAAK